MIVGYTHQDGYCLCVDCWRKHLSLGSSNSAHVFTLKTEPIFDSQGEWDSYPSCDNCNVELDEVQLTTDGVEWLNSTGRKADWQSWSDVFPEEERNFFYAYLAENASYYCLDDFCSDVLQGDKNLIAAFRQNMHNDNILHTANLCSVINETTVQYEQWAGELIPKEGVYCVACGEELYAPLEEEEDEELFGDELPGEEGKVSQYERF